MSLLCFIGHHKPSPITMVRTKHGPGHAICEGCRCPLELREDGAWRASEPLYKSDRLSH